MGSLLSKNSTTTTPTNTTEEHKTGFHNFTNSVRRSLRIKRPPVNAADGTAKGNEISYTEMSKASSRVRPGLDQTLNQKPAPVSSDVVGSQATPSEALKVVTPPPKPAEAPKDATKSVKPSDGEPIELGVIAGNKEKTADKKEEVKDKTNEKCEASAKEDPQNVTNLLFQLAPEGEAEDKEDEALKSKQSQDTKANLLAALKTRKEHVESKEESKEEGKEEGKDKKNVPSSEGVANVLESIAACSPSIKSREAVSMMASLNLPPKEETAKEAEGKGKEGSA